MEKETLLFFAVIGIVVIVLGLVFFSILTTPIQKNVKGENIIFSIKDCEKAGYSKEKCFNLSAKEIKKIKGS